MATAGGGGYPLESVRRRCCGMRIIQQGQERTPQSLVSSPLPVHSSRQLYHSFLPLASYSIPLGSIDDPVSSNNAAVAALGLCQCPSDLNIRGHCELQRCDLWQRECVKGAGWVLQDCRGTYGELVSHIPPPYRGVCAVCRCIGHAAVRSHAWLACYVALV